MNDPDFPEDLRAFIRENIPDVDAAELLLLLARNRGQRYDVPTVIDAMRPTAISESAVRRHLSLFKERGLVVQMKDDTYQYHPVVAKLDPLVGALTRVYNERPVTMVRMIYALKDEKIRSFADAFKLKQDK
jgi:DNA-binding transcriptional ArsR family regulator